MKLCHAMQRGQEKNRYYPHQVTIESLKDFQKLVAYDHVAASYQNHQRSVANFLESDVVVLDVDNDHSDNSQEWIEIEDIPQLFPGVEVYVASSRHHMKKKDQVTARPRFHVYFPIQRIENEKDYKSIKESIVNFAPYFDTNALDSARFIFGVEGAETHYFKGELTIDSFLNQPSSSFEDLDMPGEPKSIKQGSRNTSMSQYAGRVIVRLGNTEEARRLFDERSTLCDPPLSDEELNQIWQSASKFGQRVAEDPNYIPPDHFNSEYLYQPEDYSDIGQALVLAELFRDQLRYTHATGYLVYNGSYWEESSSQAVGVVRSLTDLQLEEAEQAIAKYKEALKENGGLQLMMSLSKKKAEEAFTKDQALMYRKLGEATTYREFVLQRRNQTYVKATLKIAEHLVETRPDCLDQNEFYLNTPSKTYDLKTGEVLEHDSAHLLTKQTRVDASSEGEGYWLDALNTFFQGDPELIDYVQKIVGLAAIGKVYVEAMIIAYGDGRNGKSTFWNVIAKVLGSYSGNLSADTLTMKQQGNVKYELAEAKGKRLLISAELQEGMRLNTSVVKKLCSTDEIFAEKKFKDPFSYTPSHTLVLYTNHLPKVGALDEGTWRRLIVIPFEAKIEGKSDIKNYAEFLFGQAGEAILSWIIEGAQKVIAEEFKFTQPQKVKDAVAYYKESNDWFKKFITDCCEVREDAVEKSGQLYEEYRAYCHRTGEFSRSTTDFYAALSSAGFERKKTNKGSFIYGLKLINDFI